MKISYLTIKLLRQLSVIYLLFNNRALNMSSKGRNGDKKTKHELFREKIIVIRSKRIS